MIHRGNINEQEILHLMRQKDPSAIKIIYSYYVDILSAVCSRYIICDEDVKDVLQDSFIKIFTSMDTFEYRGVGSIKAWLVRIVVNESLKFLKKNEKTDFLQYESDLPDAIDEDMDEPDARNVPSDLILDMIRLLPIGYRTVFNLFVFEKKSHKEIANLLNITESTSTSQLYRAKKMLAKWINEYNEAAYERGMDK